MNDVKNALKVFEKIKEEKIQAFEPHIIATMLNDNEMNTYAVMHSAFIAFNGSLSINQERLFEFYLPAISSNLKMHEIIKQAQELDDDKLTLGIKLLEEKQLLHTFLLDVLIFARLDGTISNEYKNMLEVFCQTLEITNENVQEIVYLSSCILGVEDKNKPSFTEISCDLIENPIWQEFIAKKVTEDNLCKLTSGAWIIDKEYKLTAKDISWSDAIVIFTKEGCLVQSDSELNIENSLLISPNVITNNVEIKFEQLQVKASFEHSEEKTLFELGNSKTSTINNSRFISKGARTFNIVVTGSRITFDNNTFKHCGSELLNGGAVAHQGNVIFTNTHFENCIAQVAGAIFSKQNIGVNNIVNCQFYNCQSVKEWDDKYNAGAIYYNTSSSGNCIVDSMIDTNISIYELNSYSGSGNALLANTLIKGMVNFRSHSINHGYILTQSSHVLNKVDYRYSKNQKVNIETNSF